MVSKLAPRRLVLALALLLASASAASAQSARDLYDQGMQALNAGRYRDAAEKFDASYRLSPVPLVLYNLGLAYGGMGYPDKAVESFEKFVQFADPTKEGRTIAAVRQEIRRIEDSYGRFNVALTPPDALIEIDGVVQQPRDGKLWVEMGQHRITIRATGYETYQQTLQVQAGKFDLQIKLREPTGPPSARAAALIDEGVALQASGNFPGAIEKYQLAQAIQPSPRGAGQLGLAEDQVGELGRAEEHLNEALAQKRDPWVKENKRKLEQTLRRIQGQLGELTISGTPDGSEIFVAGRSLGMLPFGRPVKVASGTLTVRAEHDGYEMWEQVVELPARGSTSVVVAMSRKAEPAIVAPIPIPLAAAPVTEPPPQPPPEPLAAAPPPEPVPQEPRPEELKPEAPNQADIEAMSEAQEQGKLPDEHPKQTGFELSLHGGYQFWIGGPNPGSGDNIPGSSGAIVPLQLSLGARILWPLSFGVQLNAGMDFAADGTKVVVNAHPGLYVRGHLGQDKKQLGWDVWGGTGLQPIAMQVLVLEAQPIDPSMITGPVSASAIQTAATQQATGVTYVRTIQSVNVPLELGGTLFVTPGFGIDLAMALTFWIPGQSCLQDDQDSVCVDADAQTSFFIGAGLSFLP